MHERNQRVQADLDKAGITGEITIFTEHLPTAADAAAHLGIETGAIANSLIFRLDGEPVLIMTSGAHRVDTGFVEEQTGGKISRANADVVKEATGQVIGGVAPAGHSKPIRTFIDRALAAYPMLWAAAGTADSMFPLTYAELLRLTGGEEIDVER